MTYECKHLYDWLKLNCSSSMSSYICNYFEHSVWDSVQFLVRRRAFLFPPQRPIKWSRPSLTNQPDAKGSHCLVKHMSFFHPVQN